MIITECPYCGHVWEVDHDLGDTCPCPNCGELS